MGLKEDDPNAVGFYYETSLHGVNKYGVTLFNIYDNDPIPWLRLGYTMDLLLASPFVTKITFYPLSTNQSDSSGSLLSRETMSKRSSGGSRRSGGKNLEELFRLTVIEITGINSKALHDKPISYTCLLMKVAGITNEEMDRFNSVLITGYSLVNRVLLAMMRIRESDLTKISTSIVPCPLLKKPVSIIAPRENANEGEIKFVIEESRREITKLVAVFVDLFTSHDAFRANILATRASGKAGPTNLEVLFARENELVSHIVGGLQNGMLSVGTLNDIIRDLGNERFTLGNYHSLPMSTNPPQSVQVVPDALSFTFQQPTAPTNTDPLRDLGNMLGQIADSFDSPEALTINLGSIIGAYNNAIRGTTLNKITIPHVDRNVGTHTVSRHAILTIPGDINSVKPMDGNSSRTTPIAMYNNDLTTLSESQLMELLVYIDSLRATDGSADTRFVNLQNEITHELARRRRSQISS
jgi:hypothetical protein